MSLENEYKFPPEVKENLIDMGLLDEQQEEYITELVQKLNASQQYAKELHEIAREMKWFLVHRDEYPIMSVQDKWDKVLAAAIWPKEESECERLKEALTPSAHTKATYMGEFHFWIKDYDEDGEELDRQVTVPWTTIKEIMQKIKDTALNPSVQEVKADV